MRAEGTLVVDLVIVPGTGSRPWPTNQGMAKPGSYSATIARTNSYVLGMSAR